MLFNQKAAQRFETALRTAVDFVGKTAVRTV